MHGRGRDVLVAAHNTAQARLDERDACLHTSGAHSSPVCGRHILCREQVVHRIRIFFPLLQCLGKFPRHIRQHLLQDVTDLRDEYIGQTRFQDLEGWAILYTCL